ncbi:MAG TPA: hypothetical protein DEO73_17415 [Pantoea sp.]|nr:hypothetical protein [Pantoea sp.]
MNKLTAEVARRDIDHLKSFQSDPKVGLSLKEEKYLQALEIALPVLEQQESPTDTYRQIENDGWIEWGGGERPVGDGMKVCLKFRDGDAISTDFPQNWEWEHENIGDDIIAYRVIENYGREG